MPRSSAPATDTGPRVDFDLAIVGGGPVGLFLALATRAAGLRPVVLEARAPGATQADDRSLALSWASCLRLERVGAKLPAIETGGAIRAIHVSHAGHAGRSWITASDAGIPMLGRVLGYGELVHALSGAARDAVDVRHEHAVSAIAPDDDGVHVVTAAGDQDDDGARLGESGEVIEVAVEAEGMVRVAIARAFGSGREDGDAAAHGGEHLRATGGVRTDRFGGIHLGESWGVVASEGARRRASSSARRCGVPTSSQ